MDLKEAIEQVVPKHVLNRNTHLTKYLRIAMMHGDFRPAYEELERDRRHRFLRRSTYYYIKKMLHIYERKAMRLMKTLDFRDLFLRLLRILAEDGRDKIPKKELAEKLGVDVDVVDELKKWIESNGFSRVTRLIVMGKKLENRTLGNS